MGIGGPMTSHNLKLTLLMVLALTVLVSCGSKKSDGSVDLSSDDDRGQNPLSKPQAYCNKVVDGDLEVRLMAYKDPNGRPNNSLIRMKFVKVPNEYAANNYDIRIRKWTASPTGVIRPSDTEAPLHVNTRIDLKSAGGYEIASGWGYNLDCASCLLLDWHNMGIIANDHGETYTNANVFFEKYHLLLDLEDAKGDWKGLTIVFTDLGVPVKHVNILIPTFAADPVDYVTNHPPVLNQLHPFYSMRYPIDQGWPSTQFETESNGYCF